MWTLSGGDLELINAMRKGQDRVLQDMDWTKFDFTRLIMMACSDGYELPGVMEHQRRMAEKQKPGISTSEFCCHTVAVSGGPLRLVAESPVISKLQEDIFLHREIVDGIILKKLDANGERPRVLLRTHSSCGAAAPHGMDVVEQMECVAAAKDRLKKAHHNWRILLCLDVNYGDRQRSYTFSRDYLRKWLEDGYYGSIVHITRRNYDLPAAAIARA